MFKKSPAVYLFAILSALMVTPAQARPQTFVASYGNDANPCGRVLPCRLIGRAMVETDTNGEVVVLDSANYLPITITKSISLTAPPGIYAGISVSSGAGVTIDAPGVNVVLRGLTINGLGGANGILMNSNGNLSIENCVISNFSGIGQHGVLVTTDATVRMVDTLVRDNYRGIQLQGGGVTDISGSKFLGNNNTAILATSTSAPFPSVVISDTIVTAGGTGIEAIASGTGSARISMIRSSVTNNLKGVASSTSAGIAPVTLSESMVAGNLVGYFVGVGGSLVSLGNNTITDNGSDTGGPIPQILLQ